MTSRHTKKYCDEDKAGQGLERAGLLGIEGMFGHGMKAAIDPGKALLRQRQTVKVLAG